jgi:hypothetical protein
MPRTLDYRKAELNPYEVVAVTSVKVAPPPTPIPLQPNRSRRLPTAVAPSVWITRKKADAHWVHGLFLGPMLLPLPQSHIVTD